MRKQTWILMAAILFVVTIASSGWAFTYDNIYLDVGTNYTAPGDPDDGNSTTGTFDSFKFEDETQTTITGVNADGNQVFSDSGHALVTALLEKGGAAAENEDMRWSVDNPLGYASWELTLAWEGLTGELMNPVAGSDAGGAFLDYDVVYDAGTQFKMFFDDYTGVAADFNNIFDFADDVGFADGSIEIIAEVTSGTGEAKFYSNIQNDQADGSGDNYQQVSRQEINIFYDIVGFNVVDNGVNGGDLSDFFYLENNTPLSDYFHAGVIAFATEGADRQNQRLYLDGSRAGTLQAYGDGTFGVKVVPEPSTLLLMGCGMLFAGCVVRRRKRKA